MSSGDPAERVVVDLASFQPLANGLSNQSIHSVRLQQMCPAKKRRRFLRRGNARPPGSPATNHIRKDAILVIGVDRLIIGVVEEEVKPSVDKASERSAAKAMREEEKAALRALKQEERAAARVHRDAAKAAARADRETGRTGPGGGGGGRRLGMLRMRRAASGPNIGVLVEQENADSITGGEASSPDRDPSLGSSPSLSVSPDVHRRVLQHGRSRSQHLPEVLPASDGEVEGGSFRRAKDAAGPAASSPLRISQPSPGGNGHPMRSPFTQDDLAAPTTPQQTPQEGPSLVRFSGVDVEQNTFSADVAYSQVLRIEREAEEVTVFYRPNSLGVEELSRNPVANALAVTFLLSTETAAMELVTEVERAVEHYCQGMSHLGRQLPLPGPPQVLLVTHRRPAPGAAPAEAVVQGHPSWGVTVPAPASWDSAPSADPQDGSMASAGEDVVVVYVTSPLGSGAAQISLPVVRHFLKGEEAHLFVGVTLRPPPRSVERHTSLLVRRSILPGSAEEAAEAAGSSGDWQPADSILEVEPSPASTTSTPDSTADSFTSRVNGGGSVKMLERRTKMRKSKQVRLHCIVSCPPHRAAHTAPGWPRTNGHSHSPEGLTPGSGSERHGPLLTAASFSAPAVPLLLQGQWLLLLQWALLALLVAACWHPLATQRLLTFLAACLQAVLKGERFPELPQLRASGAAAAQPAQVASRGTAELGALSGKWQLILLRAELVDDYWCAAGASLEADVGAAVRITPAEPESKLDVLTSAHGVSRDTAQRYLMAANDDLAATHRLLQASREWREVKLEAKSIMQQPQPHYEAFKDLFSHGVLGFSHSGRPIWVMRIGEIKKGLKALKATGVTPEDYERHVMFVQDYMYTVLDPNKLPEGRSIWIVDMKGVGLSDLGSEAMSYVKIFAGIVAANYPERLYRNFVVNAPGFFSLVWRIAEPMLSPSTRKKIILLHNKQDTLTAFREEMDEELIPQAYGGLNTLPLDQSKPEIELRQLVQRLNQQ
ncbi:hypothetical protein COCSUDRAFT_44590 [Coccomyxa subellipsoidea C-169]|uniref:CRAL-TRIO domain-containing protein n=1 Tax=Coccomyxa subellipsoidea (strain C-169) TaxID=574566 RepID=I0YN06_COCSC|nr:hypothetical protein COCSUDRAFT_44590 [Coccomyxa subellipsoidea C-169]EIE19775.1 hypothetical protein COCSUDRAFT_44590 [Coccomyxa subellipsoidea C-169]|eukprot:XP_005644319.1 hypothetical protein COCSUDRAFT_44590 [Coccomyxa subellipsoidea C-169]